MHYSRRVPVLIRPTFILVLSLSAGLAGMFGPMYAAASPVRSVQSYSIMVQAGTTATLDVRGIALQPASTLASEPLSLAAASPVTERVRTTLFYAIDWGYTESAPEQVALAVWYAQDGLWRSPDHAIAERIVNAASASQGSPAWRPEGRSLVPMVGDRLLIQELTLTPFSTSQSVGQGRLTLSNNSTQDLLVYLPYGTLFAGPAGNVLVWAAAPNSSQVEPPAAQPSPSETTVLADPPPSEGTATPSYKNGSTPVAESTPSYKSVRPSPTQVEGANLPPAAEPTASPEKVQDEPTPEPSPTQAPGTIQDAGASSVGGVAGAGSNVRSKPQVPAVDKPIEGAPQENVTENVSGNGAIPSQTPRIVSVPTTLSISAAPPPELPKAQPTSGTDAAIPSPVGTQPADQIPPPVPTGEADAPKETLPPAQATGAVPVKTAQPISTSTPKPTSTPEPTKEETSAGVSVDARSDQGGPVVEAKPTAQPAPVVPPVADSSPPVTVRSSDGATPSQLPVGSPPSSAPATGGGPSSTGTWLAVCAALLLVVGVQMRRASTPKSIKVSTEHHV